MAKREWSFETKQLRVGQECPDPATDARSVPIYASTSFVFRDSQQAATTAHSQCAESELAEQGIKPNTVRLSIDTENINDLIAALEDALAAV